MKTFIISLLFIISFINDLFARDLFSMNCRIPLYIIIILMIMKELCPLPKNN